MQSKVELYEILIIAIVSVVDVVLFLM